MSDTFETDSELTRGLSTFGLNPLEARIYLHLVNKPAKTILELARELDLPRTSVYDNAVKLIEKGLVERIVTFKSQRLKAYPPQILQASVDKEKQRVEALQTQLESLQARLAPNLTTLGQTEVRYFHGARGFQQMIWNTLRANKEIIGYSQFGRVEVVGEQFLGRHSKEIISRGIIDRVISNPEHVLSPQTDPAGGLRPYFQRTRFLSAKQLYITGDIAIYNNIFAAAYWQQGEVVGVEIENTELAKNQKSIFELLWQLAKPLGKQNKPK